MELFRGRHRIGPISAITVGIMVIAGILMSSSALNLRSDAGVRSSDLKSAVRGEEALLKSAEKENLALREQVKQLVQEQAVSAEEPDLTHILATGSTPVSGRGVSVQLNDATPPEDATNLDIYVVHQQDVEAVMNALWAGGAEAMTVQGSRVTATSHIRCVGNVIFVDSEVYSPPYTIAAIGDPAALQAALEADDTLNIYRQYVRRYGLGYQVSISDKLEFPARNKLPALNARITPEGS